MRTDPSRGVHAQLGLSDRPENVAVVRSMLDGVLEALGQPVESADAVRTAVSEACNNVVTHAYPDGEGPMYVDVTVRPTALEVVVRDRGTGILPHIEIADDAMRGVGLAVVQAFTDRTELKGAAGEGTTLSMEFGLLGAPVVDASPFDVRAPPLTDAEGLTSGDAAYLSLAPTPLVRPVLAHVAAALASRARFTVDRLQDTQMVSDALAANAIAAMSDGHLVVRLHPEPRALDLAVGPLRPGAGARLADADGPAHLWPLLERLTCEVRVQADSAGDMLLVRIGDDRRPIGVRDGRP